MQQVSETFQTIAAGAQVPIRLLTGVSGVDYMAIRRLQVVKSLLIIGCVYCELSQPFAHETRFQILIKLR